LPVISQDVLNTGAQGYGFLMSISGISALLGSLIVASMKPGRRGQWLILGGILFSFFLFLFSLSRWLMLSSVILIFVGTSQFMVNVIGRVITVMNTRKEFLGRVTGYFSLLNNGFTRLGAFQAGALAHYTSAPFALEFAACLCLIWMLFTTWRMSSIRNLS